MTKTCLLITERFEPTADVLVAEMRRRGMPCVRWNLDQYPIGSALTCLASDECFTACIDTDGRRVDLEGVGSVWWRGLQPSGFPYELRDGDRKFAETQARRVIASLTTIGDFVWINHPLRHVRANCKPAQLCMARRVGLTIPKTVITNDPSEARSFIAQLNGPAIYKSLSQNLDVAVGKSLFTGLLTEKELANLHLIQLTPGVFQELVPKAYEVRATVVGRRIFTARIDSQAKAETKIDWRHRPFDIDHHPISLPPELELKILAFTEAFGLVFGAFDFIVTPDGRHVFLEVNPAGQYMWIESITGHAITAALADALSAPCQP